MKVKSNIQTYITSRIILYMRRIDLLLQYIKNNLQTILDHLNHFNLQYFNPGLKLIFLFFQTFLSVKKTPWALAIVLLTSFTIHITQVSKAGHLMDFFVTQHHPFNFTYSQSRRFSNFNTNFQTQPCTLNFQNLQQIHLIFLTFFIYDAQIISKIEVQGTFTFPFDSMFSHSFCCIPQDKAHKTDLYKWDRTQPCLTPDFMHNQLLAIFPTSLQ